jgi:hypothetical protein
VILSLIFKSLVQGDEEERFHRLTRTDNMVKLRITLHIRYIATFSRKTQPVKALSLISQADGYAKGIPSRFYTSYQGTHLGLIDGLRSVLPSPMLTAAYLEPDGSPIETSIMLGYHDTVLRTSYTPCDMIFGLSLPYPGEWFGEWADKTNSQNPSGLLSRIVKYYACRMRKRLSWTGR